MIKFAIKDDNIQKFKHPTSRKKKIIKSFKG